MNVIFYTHVKRKQEIINTYIYILYTQIYVVYVQVKVIDSQPNTARASSGEQNLRN